MKYVLCFLLICEVCFSFSGSSLRRARDNFNNYTFNLKTADMTVPMASHRSSGQQYGYAVALSEDQNTMVVGAPYDDTDANGANSVTDAGAVYVYTKQGGAWVYQQKIVPSGTNARIASDNFGWSVAISGDTIVVGAPLHDYDAAGADAQTTAGAAWVFKRSAAVWNQEQKLVGTGLNGRFADDYFGWSVVIDGDTVIVGCPDQSYDASGGAAVSDAGAAFVFLRTGSTWSLQQKLVAIGTAARGVGDYFGAKLAISGDTMVAASYPHNYDAAGGNALNDAGAAYVFTRSAGVWTLQQKLVATGTNARVTSDMFSFSVALSGDTLVVGTHQQDYDVAGANSVTNAGAAYVYTRSSGTWSLQQKLVGVGTNGRVASDLFGSAVSISGDVIAIGAYQQDYDEAGAGTVTNAGAVFLFSRSGAVWSLQQKIIASGTNARVATDNFGSSVSLVGTTLVVGSNLQDYDSIGSNSLSSAGAVFIDEYSGGSWSQITRLSAEAPAPLRSLSNGAYFGYAVALSEDGNTLVIGSTSDQLDASGANPLTAAGAAYVYIKSGGTWAFQQKLVGQGTNARNASDRCGSSVAISGDTIVMGCFWQDYDATGANLLNNAGAAYVFTRSSGVWTQQQRLVGVGTNGRVAGDLFGFSVAISGDTIVVGADGQDYDDSGGAAVTDAGAAYIFTRSGSIWSLQQKIIASGTNARVTLDSFGRNVSIHNDTVVIGAYRQDYDVSGANSLTDAGASYVFVRSGATWTQQQKLVGVGTNGRAASDNFGFVNAIYGDTLAIGAFNHYFNSTGAISTISAGAVWIFVRSAGVWNVSQKITPTGTNARDSGDYFGYSLDLHEDLLVVGSYRNDYDETGANAVSDAGAAFIFSRGRGGWKQRQKLVGIGTNSRVTSDNFGYAVAISANTVAAGAYKQDTDANGTNTSSDAGAVFIFNR
ncbi:hypothetical protein [Bdellovibrio sp. HCB2-146]|uniref:hypothetical protein n=1 Tax=Bdellovibrio sp. HCB2-146 TaxID=3394362 RepID=UPI0039BC9025